MAHPGKKTVWFQVIVSSAIGVRQALVPDSGKNLVFTVKKGNGAFIY
jgi:hypothetical protein